MGQKKISRQTGQVTSSCRLWAMVPEGHSLTVNGAEAALYKLLKVTGSFLYTICSSVIRIYLNPIQKLNNINFL